MVANEDKNTPLTDEQIAETLKNKGVPIARRTVSKYRKILKINDAKVRKVLKNR